MRNKYDIFISYRRESGRDYARLIQQTLQKEGYSVFYDFDTIHDHVFNTQIYGAIKQAPIFILVLTQHSMDRCVDEKDWVRREVEYAIRHNIKIVPINVNNSFDGFKVELLGDESIGKHISEIQYSHLDMGQLYEASINKIINERIRPVIKPPMSVNLKVVLIAVTAAIAIISAIFGYIWIQNDKEYKMLSNEVCVAMSPHIINVNYIIGVAKDANKEWLLYTEELKGLRDLKDTLDIYNDFIANINYKLPTISFSQSSLSLSPHEEQILRRKSVDVRDIYGFFEVSMPSLIEDYTEMLNWLKFYASPQFYLDNKLLSDNNMSDNFRYLEISTEMQLLYYYGVASYFPVDAVKKTIDEISREYINLPSIEPYRPTEYYENQSAKLLNEIENMAIKQANNIQRAQEELSKLKDKKKRVTTVSNIMQSLSDIDSLQNEVNKMELAFTSLYDRQLLKFKIEETDDKWLMWSKVVNVGAEARSTQDRRIKQESLGGRSNYIYSLDYMYGNVYKWIDEYISYHPEESSYAEATRYFYKNIHAQKVDYRGVIVVGFSDNEKHPIYNVGDIIVERNGVVIQNMKQYMEALKVESDSDPVVKILRFSATGEPQFSTHIIPRTTTVLIMCNDMTIQP